MRAEEAKERRESEWNRDRVRHVEKWTEGHEVCGCRILPLIACFNERVWPLSVPGEEMTRTG